MGNKLEYGLITGLLAVAGIAVIGAIKDNIPFDKLSSNLTDPNKSSIITAQFQSVGAIESLPDGSRRFIDKASGKMEHLPADAQVKLTPAVP